MTIIDFKITITSTKRLSTNILKNTLTYEKTYANEK